MTLPIAIDYTAALKQGGGIGRYTRELVSALARLDSETPYVLFTAGQMGDLAFSTPGANFVWKTARLSPDWLARLWHRAHLRLFIEGWTGPIAILHAPDFTLPPTRRGVQTLLTVHDLTFIRAPDAATPRLRAYLNAVVPRSVQRADHILADSEATRQDLMEFYRTPADKISVLYSGVESRFRPIYDSNILRAVRERYHIGDQLFILSIGTIQPRKNYERLVEALHRLGQSDLKLVIAGGKGWLADSLYRKVESLGIKERVQFLGFVDDADLPALYSAAHIFAYPSLYEGFGLPPLEAMACGVPVIASNTSSLPEVVGDAGLLIDPYDVNDLALALAKVLGDENLHRRLSEMGQQRARKFSWDAAAVHLRKCYDELLDL